MAKARKAGASQDQREEIQQGYWAETEELQQELEALRTKRVLRQAHRLDVSYPPIPWKEQRNEFWIQGNMTGEWYLTTGGMSLLQTAIWAKIKARHEARAPLIVWMSAITGLVAALTGLLAVLFAVLKK